VVSLIPSDVGTGACGVVSRTWAEPLGVVATEAVFKKYLKNNGRGSTLFQGECAEEKRGGGWRSLG